MYQYVVFYIIVVFAVLVCCSVVSVCYLMCQCTICRIDAILAVFFFCCLSYLSVVRCNSVIFATSV